MMRRILACAFTLLLWAQTAQATTPTASPLVQYDKRTDKLTIEADKASLKELLARIQLASGVEISMDPTLERPVSMQMKDQPLEAALLALARRLNLNHALFYGRPAKAGKAPSLLIGMHVLPSGTASGNIAPVVDPNLEAFVHTRAASQRDPSARLPEVLDPTSRRWQERLRAMSPQRREQLQAKAVERVKRLDERKAEKQKRREERRAEREKRRAEREAELAKLRQRAGNPADPRPDQATPGSPQ